MLYVFFVKQKTAYEMRISDWSSDVCSSDLSDHGQCIHPDRAYEDAVAGVTSKSDPKVTNDRAMLRGQDQGKASGRPGSNATGSAYGSYRDSVYHELKGLIEAPVTPMLKPARTVRTLILPYADRQRPDRLSKIGRAHV